MIGILPFNGPPLAKLRTYMLREPIKVVILTNLKNFQNQNKVQGNNHPQGNNQRRNQFFQGASHGQNPPPAYQAPVYQASGYQTPAHQPLIPQLQVVTTIEFTNYMKANDAILKNMQTNMTSLTNSNLELKNMFGQFMKMNTASSSGRTFMKRRPEECYDLIENMTAHHNGWNTFVQRIVQVETQTPNSEPVVTPVVKPVEAPVSALKPNPKPSISYSSRHHDQKLCDKANDQKEKFFQIFQDLNFNISFADALILMPMFGPTIKSLLTNKDKLFELPRTPLNEHCLEVILKKLPEKLGDPGKFIIPCDFSGMVECLALADLGASINLMPLSVNHPQGKNQGRNQIFQGASHGQNPPPAYQAPAYQDPGYQALVHQPPIPQPQVVTTNEFTNFMKANDVILKNMQTNMTSLTNSNLELKNMFGQFMKMNTTSSLGSGTLPGNTITNPKEDLKGITTRSRTAYQGPIIPTASSSLPQVVKRETEAITFNLDQTSRYSANYNDMTANRIDVIDMACKEYSQEVLGFSDVIVSGNPTPYYDPIVSTSSSTLTPFGDSDFLLEEVDAFLALEDDTTLPKVDHSYFDLEGDILLLEAFLNDDPSLPPPNQGNYLPQVRKELKICEAKTDKSSINEPPKVELKDLPPHLKYEFLEGDDKLPVIIAKYLSVEEKAALIKVLKSHKQAIAWKLSDNKGAVFMARKPLTFSRLATMDPPGTSWPELHRQEGLFPSSREKIYILVVVDYLSKWVEAKALPTKDARVVCKFLKSLFARFKLLVPSLVIAEKTKRLHDFKIKDRIFNVGDRVLLFNSRLKIFSGKLKTRWSGPFTITHVFPYGTIELSKTDMPNFKVNGHRLRHYFREDMPRMVVMDLQTFPKDQ
nr:reverse transcriptase domain-containing protein [Tanacetum cinerariifolium]